MKDNHTNKGVEKIGDLVEMAQRTGLAALKDVSAVTRRFFAFYSGFERDAKLLILSGLIGSIAWGFSNVIYAPYLDMLGIDWTLIGVTMMVFPLTSAILTIPFGILADRYGRKPFIILGVILSSISFAAYFVARDFATFCVAQLLGGLAGAMSWSPSTALLSEKATDEKRKYVFGLSSFGWSLGAVIGYILGGFPEMLTAFYGFEYTHAIRSTYLATALITFTSVFPLFLVKESKKQPGNRKTSRRINIKSWRVTAWFSSTQALIGLGAGFMIPWFSLYFRSKFGVELSAVGATFAISEMGMAVSFLVSPRMVEKIGSVKTIVSTQGAAIVTLLLIALSPTFGVASVLYVIRIILMNMSGPVSTSFLMGLLSEEERASVNSVVSACWSIPFGAVRPAAGYTMEHMFLDLNLFVCASLYASSTAIFYGVFKRLDDAKKQKEGR